VTEARVAAIRAGLKPAPWDRFGRYGAWRVPEETSHYLIRRGGADILDAVVKKTGVDALTAAVMIGQRARALARAGIPVQRLGAAEWIDVFDLYTDGRIPREAVPVVAGRMAKDGLRAADAASVEGIALVARDVWQRDLDGLGMDGYLPGKTDGRDKRLRFLAGRAMKQLKGRAPAKEVAAWLAGRLEEIAR
jgi:Glu-tRNA(Gln) amidotransferase subunit E-like FAD-binding protein